MPSRLTALTLSPLWASSSTQQTWATCSIPSLRQSRRTCLVLRCCNSTQTTRIGSSGRVTRVAQVMRGQSVMPKRTSCRIMGGGGPSWRNTCALCTMQFGSCHVQEDGISARLEDGVCLTPFFNGHHHAKGKANMLTCCSGRIEGGNWPVAKVRPSKETCKSIECCSCRYCGHTSCHHTQITQEKQGEAPQRK